MIQLFKRLIIPMALLLILVNACVTTVEPQELPDYTPQFTDLQNQINSVKERVSTIEANHIVPEPIVIITSNDTNLTSEIGTGVLQTGCPSDADIDFWFEQNITDSQMDKLLEKYNSEECN